VTRVIVASDLAAAQRDLAAALARRPSVTIIAQTHTGAPLAELVAATHPDVVVLDLADGEPIPSMSPGDTAGDRAGDVAYVILASDVAARGAAALRAGVRALLPRDATGDDIAAAVDAAAAGLVVLHPDAIPALGRGTSPRATVDALTPRERQVLNLLADGLGNKIIGARLGISDHTVKAHLGAIFDKLHVSTRAEAVALGLRLGLIAL
jgi:DNA-binding NarL/FixJ family response regulator